MALAGRIKEPGDASEALVLNEHLCHLRCVGLHDASSVADKALEGAKKLNQTNETKNTPP